MSLTGRNLNYLKVLAIALIIAISVSVAPSLSAPKRIKIRFAMFGGPPEISLYKDVFIPEFEKKYPYIEIELEVYPHGEYLPKLMAEYVAGTLPDVVKLMDVQILSMVKSGMLRPLDDFINDPKIGINKSDFFDFTWKLPGLIYNNKTYGIPIDFLTFALYYNPELFKKAGLDPNKPPRTWEELLEYSKALVKVTDYGFCLPGWDLPWFIFLYEAGGKVWERANGKVVGPAFNKEPGVKALTFIADMIHKYKVAYPNIWGATPPLTLFAEGKLAMLIDGPWEIAALRKDYPNFTTWRTAPLPAGPAGRFTPLFGSAFGVSSLTKHPKEAWLVVKELTSDWNERNWAIKYGISPPSRKKVFEELMKTEPRFKPFVIPLKEVKVEFYIEKYPAFREILGPELQSVYNPDIRKDPRAALNDAAKRAIQEIFKR